MQKAVNPFINSLIVPYIQYVTEIKSFTPIAGERYGYELETSEYVRVYTHKEIREFVFRKLSMYARDMLSACQYFVNPKYEYVIINYDKMQELYGPDYKLVRRRFDDTIRELIKMSILDVKDKAKSQYWYNPGYFCAGNRLKMYDQCKYKVMVKDVSPQKLSD